MKFVTITELIRSPTTLIREIETTKEKVVLTKRGKPVVLMLPVSGKEFELKPEFELEPPPEARAKRKGGKRNGKG